MSLKPDQFFSIPATTWQVAKAAFPKDDNLYMNMRDELGIIYADEDFADLFAVRGKPAEAPGRLALVTLMQYAEGLTDREAAEAVRARIDWKYALGLPLDDAGFHYTVLTKFRARLLAGKVEARLLEAMLTTLDQKGLLKTDEQQRTDSTHILGAIRHLNRVELVGETLRQSLNHLALVAPDWLRRHAPEGWFERYGEPLQGYRLPKEPHEQEALAMTIGQDGRQLLEAITADQEHPWLQKIPAVILLWRVWIQQYGYGTDGTWHWRANDETPPATLRIISPYDVEARQGVKRETRWFGYKVHLTETCTPEAPRLITHVETRIACEADIEATEDIHRALAEKDRTPAQHLVDTAYVSAPQLVASQETYQIDLLGPVLPDTSWQANTEGAYDITQFAFTWEQQRVTCPQGKQSLPWRERLDRHGKPVISASFSQEDCVPCPAKSLCTRSEKNGRKLSFRPQREHAALQTRRQEQQTEAFQEAYALRAGVEGVISQTAYALGMRRTRYRGLPKTHLQHLATATAVNLKRAVAWLLGIPTAVTPISRFAALAPT